MMDLYDAIEYIEELLAECDEALDVFGACILKRGDLEAIEIILEAAKDKAGT